MNGRCAAGSSDFFNLPGTPHADALVVSSMFSGVAPLSSALDFHLERHNLLAANLANVDTPRYKPLDLARAGNDGNGANGSFEQAMQVALTRTNEAHLQVSGTEPLLGRVFQDLSAGGGADGNYVSLDRESGKLAANRLRYDMVSVLVKTQLDALMRAASDGKA